MFILVLIGVYLVFKVTTSYEKLHQDNTRSTERYVILREVIKLYKILEIVVISTQRDSLSEKRISRVYYTSELRFWGVFCVNRDKINIIIKSKQVDNIF